MKAIRKRIRAAQVEDEPDVIHVLTKKLRRIARKPRRDGAED